MYRAKCPWCRGYGPKQRTRKLAIRSILLHMRRKQHPKRNKFIVYEALKRSVIEV
jgi:hypothetical protein